MGGAVRVCCCARISWKGRNEVRFTGFFFFKGGGSLLLYFFVCFCSRHYPGGENVSWVDSAAGSFGSNASLARVVNSPLLVLVVRCCFCLFRPRTWLRLRFSPPPVFTLLASPRHVLRQLDVYALTAVTSFVGFVSPAGVPNRATWRRRRWPRRAGVPAE